MLTEWFRQYTAQRQVGLTAISIFEFIHWQNNCAVVITRMCYDNEVVSSIFICEFFTKCLAK